LSYFVSAGLIVPELVSFVSHQKAKAKAKAKNQTPHTYQKT